MTENSMEYVAGEDGWYLKKVNPIFSATIRVGSNPTADSVKESLVFSAKKIKGSTFRAWQAFCREVASRNKGYSEAALMLMYHPEKKEWQAFPPKQDLSSVTVDFSGVSDALVAFRKEYGSEWLLAGTLHSHPGDAHPSQTDVDDERKMDGVHLVIPDFGKGGEKGIYAHIVASGVRFRVTEVPGFLVDFSDKGEDDVPEGWYKQCEWDKGVSGKYKGGRGYGGYSRGNWSEYGGYQSGTAFVYKNEGPGEFEIQIGDKLKFNVLAQKFDGISAKLMLKILGFSKKQRRYLDEVVGDTLTDIVASFDAARDALRHLKEIRGSVSQTERETAIDRCGDAVARSIDVIGSVSTLVLKGFKPDNTPDGKEEEDKAESDPASKKNDLPV